VADPCEPRPIDPLKAPPRRQEGQQPRHFQNTLVFLAPDEQNLDNLFQALADRRAWQRVIHEKLLLQITVNQEKEAERKIDEATRAISAWVPETWCHLLVPYQNEPAPHGAEWDEKKLSGGKGSLAELLLSSQQGVMCTVGLQRTAKHARRCAVYRLDQTAGRQQEHGPGLHYRSNADCRRMNE